MSYLSYISNRTGNQERGIEQLALQNFTTLSLPFFPEIHILLIKSALLTIISHVLLVKDSILAEVIGNIDSWVREGCKTQY